MLAIYEIDNVHVVWNPGETLQWRAIHEFYDECEKASNCIELIS